MEETSFFWWGGGAGDGDRLGGMDGMNVSK